MGAALQLHPPSVAAVCDPPHQCGSARQPRSARCSGGGGSCLHVGSSAACVQAPRTHDSASTGTAARSDAALPHGLKMSVLEMGWPKCCLCSSLWDSWSRIFGGCCEE
ncbi:hypothetical protein DUNSADRAFT_2935 [Dunaliella salina]|uniref:Uncharacterized protein n=1 Tax=Dunaliella salina TaxID=3046 RepID=A0ABQ7GV09_DUNSA|nr:hypothetical protein DUNSADRAFT_2935 [Dunaliella salina]|eukprot:KAF5838399.1 hypothetical protein DUNSADRAFT_2935 [Dunaliella salina]